jgi:hypothetical protein
VIAADSSGRALARVVAAQPTAVAAEAVRERIAAYYRSYSPVDLAAREALFADECRFEDPAGAVVATDRASLHAFFAEGIPAHWVINFRLDRVAVVGQEALSTSTLTLRVGPRAPVEVIVNAHFVFDEDALITSVRTFFDEHGMTDIGND